MIALPRVCSSSGCYCAVASSSHPSRARSRTCRRLFRRATYEAWKWAVETSHSASGYRTHITSSHGERGASAWATVDHRDHTPPSTPSPPPPSSRCAGVDFLYDVDYRALVANKQLPPAAEVATIPLEGLRQAFNHSGECPKWQSTLPPLCARSTQR